MDGKSPAERVSIRRYRLEDGPRVKAITEAAFGPVSIDAEVDRRWPGVAPAPWIERKWASMRPQVEEHPEHCWVAVAPHPGPLPPGAGSAPPHPQPLRSAQGRLLPHEGGGGRTGPLPLAEGGEPVEGDVVGYVTCEVLAERGTGRIPDLAVDARWRGRGLGRRLLQHALAYFRELGLPLAKIETLAHNEAGRHLYPSLGFELVATQYHYVMPLAPEPAAEGAAPAAEE